MIINDTILARGGFFDAPCKVMRQQVVKAVRQGSTGATLATLDPGRFQGSCVCRSNAWRSIGELAVMHQKLLK